MHIVDLKRVADLGSPPITRNDAKTQGIITFSDDDTFIDTLLTKATRAVENHCNISIIYQRIQLIADMDEAWELPYGPIIGLESVETPQSQSGSGVTLYEPSETDWRITGSQFSPTSCRRYKLVYTAGNYCPDDLKQVILEVLVFMYENRGKTGDADQLERILNKANYHRKLLWI